MDFVFLKAKSDQKLVYTASLSYIRHFRKIIMGKRPGAAGV